MLRGATSLILLLACLGCNRAPSRPQAKTTDAPTRVLVGSVPNCGKLIHYVRATRPKNAKRQVVTGTVRLRARISKSGTMIDAEVLAGNPALVPAALSAVRQWRYAPCLLSGEPVEFIAVIDVPFRID